MVGPSGCGKPSLLNVAVVPLLNSDPAWLVGPSLVPGSDPLPALAWALVSTATRLGLDWSAVTSAAGSKPAPTACSAWPMTCWPPARAPTSGGYWLRSSRPRSCSPGRPRPPGSDSRSCYPTRSTGPVQTRGGSPAPPTGPTPDRLHRWGVCRGVCLGWAYPGHRQRRSDHHFVGSQRSGPTQAAGPTPDRPHRHGANCGVCPGRAHPGHRRRRPDRHLVECAPLDKAAWDQYAPGVSYQDTRADR
jgi:hypothetical protein